nr:uncharacterized mitochondrial protein AtMg00710-like [Lolium perenne]
MERSMMESKGLPGKFWGEAVNTAVYLLNRAPTRSIVGGTPYEAWYGRKPSIDHLHTFGCVAHVKTVSSHKSKLANRSTPMIMTGYEEGSSMIKELKLTALPIQKVEHRDVELQVQMLRLEVGQEGPSKIHQEVATPARRTKYQEHHRDVVVQKQT